MARTVLSFYCDDTNPYSAPPEAFGTFLDFVAAEGIAGEASAILGYRWAEYGLLSRPRTDAQRAFVAQLARADACGIDTHCELLTHGGVYDWEADNVPEGAIHEGVWTYEPDVSVEAYESYLEHIIAEGERIGVRFSGVTWPGCGCDACTQRFQALRERGITEPNPNVWQALLILARRNRFRRPSVPCFVASWVEQCAARLTAGEGDYGVYDLPPTAADRFGIWLNAPDRVDADYYISADGRSGRLVDVVRAGAPYCLFYAHWQGLNPVNGVGWDAFTRVVGRVHQHLGDQTVWMRPSDYTDALLHERAHP
jgi:hypothetical protein